MKKLLALLLCLILCLSLFACNASEEPTEAPTGTEAPTEAEKPTETDKVEPEYERVQINLVENCKFNFEGKKIDYIVYSSFYRHTNTATTEKNEFIFKDRKKIMEIVDFFESAELTKGYSSYSSNGENESYRFYFSDNTYVVISVLPEVNKIYDNKETYIFPDYNSRSKEVICK